jgi:hypothetical protein
MNPKSTERVILLTLCFLCSSALNLQAIAAEIKDDVAKHVIEDQLNKQSRAKIYWIGKFLADLVDNWKTKTIGYPQRDTLQSLQAAGLLTYTEGHRELSAAGYYVTYITIKPTSLVQSYVHEKDGYGWCEVPAPKYKVNEIVKKDRYQAPMGEVVFLAGTLDVDVSSVFVTWSRPKTLT